MNTLHKKAAGRYVFLVAVMSALVFIPAGTVDY